MKLPMHAQLHSRLLVVVVPMMITTGCADSRDDATRAGCPPYEPEVQHTLNAECVSCHDATSASGDYDVSTASGVWARNPAGVARVVPGDLNCLVLAKTRDGAGDHPLASAAAVDLLTRWIVTCEGSPLVTDLVHPRGIVNHASPDFHGKALRDSGWDFGACAICHGKSDDAFGGSSGKSCLSCHAGGPTACDTCHGAVGSPAPPADVDGHHATSARGVGAHRAHLVAGPTLPTGIACSECHLVPADWRDPGHVFNADGTLDEAPAEVVLGPLAAASLEDHPDWRTAPPRFDPRSQTCSNVYCHGGALADATLPPPTWTGVSDTPSCQRCHRAPPRPTHIADWSATDCVLCHELVVDATGAITDASRHGDGLLTLGDGSRTCSACHGSPQRPAPPPGLDDSPESLAAIGGHELHLAGSSFAGRAKCSACHLLPRGDSFLAAVTAPGHIDSGLPAEVFPGGADFTGIAGRDHAMPVYDRATHTCTGVYCHAGGAALAADSSPDIIRTLPWTDVVTGSVQCGACHGLPPVATGHPVVPAGLTCANCHPISVRADLSVIIAPNGTSAHVDGDVE